jgi:drug/metabolite transporter (DMT)-like permease
MGAYAALAFLSFLWGSSFLLIKIASRAFDPFSFALARVAVAAAAMLLTSALSGKVWPGSRPGLWLNLLAIALIGQVVPFILLGKAATLTTSADMALMMGAQPIFIFLFGRLLGSRDRWTWLGALGLLVGFAGVGFTFWAPGAREGAHSALGRGFALAAVAAYGTGAIISGAATREIGAVRAVTASMTISTLVLAATGLAFRNPPPLATLFPIPLAPTLAMVALGVFCLFPARPRGGPDLREPQQLCRAAHRRCRRSGRARRTDRALGLGGTGACAVRRGAHRPIAAARESASGSYAIRHVRDVSPGRRDRACQRPARA